MYLSLSLCLQFGVQVPRTVNEAYKLDLEQGQTKWRDAMNAELSQINNYKMTVRCFMI